jgi:hypothetical protein
MTLYPKNYKKVPISLLNSVQNLLCKAKKSRKLSRFENLYSVPVPVFQKNSCPDPGPVVQEKYRYRNYTGWPKKACTCTWIQEKYSLDPGTGPISST